MITQEPTQQLNLTAKDALRLQREIPGMDQSFDPIAQKFEKAVRKGNLSTVRTLEMATTGTHYFRLVKKPVLLPDRSPHDLNISERNCIE